MCVYQSCIHQTVQTLLISKDFLPQKEDVFEDIVTMFKGFCPGDTHLEFSRNFCEMGPSSKDVFDHIVVPGGYSSMIWVGTCRWDLKSRPIFIPNFAEKWDLFYTRATNFKQNLLKISHYFPKLLGFQANFRNFGIRLMKLGPFFAPILENFENMTHVYTSFCTE